MRAGAPAEQAVQQATQQHGITHEQDLAVLRELGTQLANSGGLRAHFVPMAHARSAVDSAMRAGTPAEQAVQQATQQHGITHEQDLAAPQQHAARFGA